MSLDKLLGIDIGTQGARLLLTDSKGVVIREINKDFDFENGRIEQNPNIWWKSTLSCLKEIREDCIGLKSISVTSTSGTIIPLGNDNNPLHDALMYSDTRSSVESKEIEEILGVNVKPSYSLSKMLWFKKNYPQKYREVRKWVHATDFIIGKLTGIYSITDYTNALKSGFDVSELKWININKIGLDVNHLPKVVAPGSLVSNISTELSELLRLDKNIQIVAGLTDGCASQFASGACEIGQWSSTIGTTLVLKGVSEKLIQNEVFYSHKHPDGYYLPGGASNMGGDWISKWYTKDELMNLNKYANQEYPSEKFIYPLLIKGERFPFQCEEAYLIDDKYLNDKQRYLAGLEAVGYIEKMAFDSIEKITESDIEQVFVAGGGTKSEAWLQIRSSILNKQLIVTENPNAAFGAVLIAASQTLYNSLSEAKNNMIHINKIIKPDDSNTQYKKLFKKYKEWLRLNLN